MKQLAQYLASSEYTRSGVLVVGCYFNMSVTSVSFKLLR